MADSEAGPSSGASQPQKGWAVEYNLPPTLKEGEEISSRERIQNL